MTPGIYPALPFAEYFAADAISSGLLRTLLDRCPRAAWYESWLNPKRERAGDDNAASDRGTIAHAILLEGSEACATIIDPANFPAKNGNVPDGWTNPSIRAARSEARAAGKVPVLSTEMPAIRAMVDAARSFLESVKDAEPAVWRAFQPAGGDSEVSIFWDDDGVLCRMRPDRINANRSLIVDAKFTATSAEPGTWGSTQMVRMGYYVDAAFYRRGALEAFGTAPSYVFLVVEVEPPHLCSLVGVDAHGLELGGAKIETALREWRACLERNVWPAYPNRVCYPEIPPWEESRWQDREILSFSERLLLGSQA
jgi:PDDEXK-like domain of unknown function (DUF3799)